MYRKLILFTLIVVLALSVLSGCKSGKDNGKDNAVSKLKIGVVYIGNTNDPVGFSTEHYKGIREAAKKLGIKDNQILERQEVADSDNSCKEVFESLINQGCNVIIGTSYGYGVYMDELAKEYENVIFMHCSGSYKNAVNYSNFFGRMYQARYLTGIAAGLKTTTNKIGYVAAFPIPEVVRGLNAFTLGVKSVNPDATVEVMWTNTWGDPNKEKSIAESLITTKGCDVIAQHQDSDAAQRAANEAENVWAIGYHSDMKVSAPKASLTSAIWHLDVYYTEQLTDIINDEWKPGVAYWGGIKEGVVGIAPLTDKCAEGTQAKVDEIIAKFKDGTFDVFANYEIKDNAGNVKVTESTKLTDEELLSMDWLVEGVIGSIG